MVSPNGHFKVSDAERALAISRLSDAHATGRLTRAEFNARADRARDADTYGDLEPLFADLPGFSAPQPETTAAGSMLLSSADRERVMQRLADALQAGRLTPIQFQDRSGAVLAAKTHADLLPLLSDLPAPPPPPMPLNQAPIYPQPQRGPVGRFDPYNRGGAARFRSQSVFSLDPKKAPWGDNSASYYSLIAGVIGMACTPIAIAAIALGSYGLWKAIDEGRTTHYVVPVIGIVLGVVGIFVSVALAL